jgi:hypothetical protein
MFRLSMLLLCITSLVSVVHAADMVVIHSNDIRSFPKGKLLDSHEPLNLPENAEISVVFATGGLKTITGPYQGRLADPLAGTPVTDSKLVYELADAFKKIDKFLKKPKKSSSRGRQLEKALLPRPQQPQNIWWVNVSTPVRSYCIAPASNVILWRPKNQSNTVSRLLIKHKKTKQKAEIEWPANQTTLQWPEELPVIYGETYRVTVKTRRGSSSFRKWVLYQLPEHLPTKSHQVVWMVSRRCISQAHMLLTSLR